MRPDLFALGSHHEACGFAAIEACACGAAPVLTDIPSFRAITGDGQVGERWHAGDAVACAAALVRAANDSASQRARVRAHFERNLSWSAVAQRALCVYDAALSTRRMERRL
ncbi:MAG: glycosyltransferase [Vicinamibacterales bacterium]